MSTHVLVPIDGSERSWKALEYAFDQFAGERITVVHVVDPAEGIHAGFETGYYDDRLFEEALDHGEELCEEARERLENRRQVEDTVLETSVETGRPARTIIDYADENDVDHVVIGSHGRTGVSRVLLGSVAETVTRRVGVPVTIVR